MKGSIDKQPINLVQENILEWNFDQGENVACITSPAVMEGQPVLVVIHYADDHSWAFLDGVELDPSEAKVVSMKSVVDLHPDLHRLAELPPGYTAFRPDCDTEWSAQQNED